MVQVNRCDCERIFWCELPSVHGKVSQSAERLLHDLLLNLLLNVFAPFVALLLLCCNDVESNPGPLPGSTEENGTSNNGTGSGNAAAGKRKPGKERNVTAAGANQSTDRFQAKITDRVYRDDRHKILEGRQDILEGKLEMLSDHLELQKSQMLELNGKSRKAEDVMKRIDQLEQLILEKSGLVEENAKLRAEAEETRNKIDVYQGRLSEVEVEIQGVRSQLNELLGVYDDLQDRLYEIDRSWQNNLVFFGIKQDSGGMYESMECLEHKVRAVIRNQLNIGRDIPIGRAQRIYNGCDVRGFKPVIVNFVKWSDKEDVLRKAKILKSSGIYVEEDFSRAAKFRRKELEKLAKEVKQLSPEKRCTFKYDKLLIDDNVYIYNDAEKRIEKLPYSISASSGLCLEEEMGDAASLSRRIRNRNAATGVSMANSSGLGAFSMAAKRAQSVESVLERIPQVVVNPIQTLVGGSMDPASTNSQLPNGSLSPTRTSSTRHKNQDDDN